MENSMKQAPLLVRKSARLKTEWKWKKHAFWTLQAGNYDVGTFNIYLPIYFFLHTTAIQNFIYALLTKWKQVTSEFDNMLTARINVSDIK